MTPPARSFAGLSRDEKPALLARLLRDRAAQPRRYPLSFGQQRLWFLDLLAPGNPSYNQYFALRLAGELDTQAFTRAINEIVRRHSSLRTTFESGGGEPRQVVHAELLIDVPVADLSALAPEPREAEALRLANEEARRPFNLQAGPLLRAGLLKLGDAAHVFLLTLHHIVSDGWSASVFFRELSALHDAFSSGCDSPLEPLPIQYADYAAWQREYLRGEVLDSQVAYWRSQLADLPALELPLDRPRPPVSTFRGGYCARTLDARLSNALRRLSRREGATLFMTLLAAFQVLLMRITGQEDIVVGSPVANRTHAEVEALIGFFVNTLVMRADLRGNPAFLEALARVKETALGAYEHQDIPFEKLVEEFQPQRDISRNPLYQVTFQVYTDPEPWWKSDAPGTESLDADAGTALFDLSATVHDQAECLVAQFEYNADLFTASTMAGFLDCYVTLLESAVADARERVWNLHILPASQRRLLVDDWNATRCEWPSAETVPELVYRWCLRTPEAPAVVQDGRILTYGELGAKACEKRDFLQQDASIGGDLVTVSRERSPEWIAEVLGIWLAGCVYVPVDPALPELRRRWMREASEGGAAGDTAYVIFTSGSTGTPKGVEIAHGGLLNLVLWHQRRYNITSGHRATQVASMSFDASIWEVWPYLAAGACVHIYGRETLAAPAELMRRIAGDAIDFAFLPTPVAEAVLDEEWPAHTRLKVLLTGGDALHRAPLRAQPFTLVNHYGLTEASVVATCAVVEPGEGVPAIGKPIANTRLYIVDRALNLVPVGAAGELCIAGDGLARGYRHRDALTHAQFVDCPFESAGARMYRTGDRARYREDGSVEFLGRMDQQVKIRGLRIEPGEVEAVLRAHEWVREAAVVARAARGGEKQLVAYAVLDRPMEESELREYLRKRLPEYMLPAALVVIDEMPMNNSGKIDRSALPDPEDGRANAASVVAPRNELERKIAAAWREVLGVEHVGVDQNFFELGGHSLLLVKLQQRLQKALGRVVGVMDLFQHPTVAALARTLAYPLLEKPDANALKERAARQRKSMLRRISEARPGLDATETLKPTEATKDSRRTRRRISLRPLQKES